MRKSSAETDQNVHNLETRKDIPAQNSWSCFIFYYYIYESNIRGSIPKGTGGSHVACSTLGNLIHDEGELCPQWDLPPFCLRLWFDMTVGMTEGLVTILHMFPPLWLLKQLIHDNLYGHTVIKDGSCRKITWQKKCTWLFFTLIQMSYYCGSWHT